MEDTVEEEIDPLYKQHRKPKNATMVHIEDFNKSKSIVY